MKYTQSQKIAFLIWFFMSVLFLGTPSPFVFFLPGVFIVDALHMPFGYASTVVVILFGSLLNFFIYMWVAKLVDTGYFTKKNKKETKEVSVLEKIEE